MVWYTQTCIGFLGVLFQTPICCKILNFIKYKFSQSLYSSHGSEYLIHITYVLYNQDKNLQVCELFL